MSARPASDVLLTAGLLCGALCIPIRTATAAQTRPAAPGLRSERVSFTTQDNLVIFAGYTPPPPRSERAPVAILVHMYRSDRTAYAPLIPLLHQAGFGVLAIDLRGHGESTGVPEMRLAERVARRDQKLFAAMDNDVEAAFLWMMERPELDPSRVALVGASVGASIVLEYAARDKSVDAVVCLTPGTQYLNLDAIGAVEKYGKRALLLMASEPERAAADHLARVAADATVKTYPLSDGPRMKLHGTRLLGAGLGVEKDIVTFLRTAVGGPSREVVVASLRGQVYYAPGASMANRLNRRNVRWFSSPDEAEQRGLRPPRNRSHGRSRPLRAEPVSEGEAFPDEPDP